MKNVQIYTKDWCPYSHRAKALLDDLGVAYREIDVTTDTLREGEMIKRSGRTSVPQVFVDDRHVGGSDDLAAAVDSGEFDQLLNGSTLFAKAS